MENNKNNEIDTNSSSWQTAAVASAVVAGVFSVIIGLMLIVNQTHLKVTDDDRAKILEVLQDEYSVNKSNEKLLENLRQLDIELRADRLRRQNFLDYGTYLLIGGVVVFCVCINFAFSFKPNIPTVKQVADKRGEQVKQAYLARLAMRIGLAAIVVAAVGLKFWPVTDIDRSGEQVVVTPEPDITFPTTEEIAKNWPSFRGPAGAGISSYANVPTKWDGKTGEGILWKTKVPLGGYGSPVVWGDKVFISAADETTSKVFCFDANSGQLVWEKQVQTAADEVDVMEDTGLAASTVVTDGRIVCAIFASGNVGCFDMTGTPLWSKSLGLPDNVYGYASSLAMHENNIIVQYDQAMPEDEMSSLIALDAFTGAITWEKKRDVANSWTSPVVVSIDGKETILTCGDPWVIAYDATSGDELWRVDCLGTDVAPSPIYAGGFVIAIEPYMELLAIRPDGQGDVTETHIAWTSDEAGPDIASPVSDGEFLYVLDTAGEFTCFNIKDGTMVWQEDLDVEFQASPSIAAGKLYLLDAEGTMIIAAGGSEFKEIGRCELGEGCYASPAFMDGKIIIRGHENLYCIGGVSTGE